MGATAHQFEMEPWVVTLSMTDQVAARRELLLSQPDACCKENFDALYDGVIALLRTDVGRAYRVAEEAGWLAAQLNDRFVNAKAARMQGHVLAVQGKYNDALAQYEASIAEFDALHSDFEAAITINASLQTLIYGGHYERAFNMAERARAVFEAHNDQTRLARLEISIGNIYYRQDRFRDAVDRYELAYRKS